MKREYAKQKRTYFQEKFKKNAPKIIFMIISHIQKTKQTTTKNTVKNG